MARHEFKPTDVEMLLAQCHRRCCVCHRYCGVKIEVDHIESAGLEGSSGIDNAIALCFECHAEVHHYNPAHPKGRRFRPSELKKHRDEWLRLCRERPDMFVHAMPSPEAGSLERLHSELVFNRALSELPRPTAAFEVTQFRRAIADGTFSWVSPSLSEVVQKAYAAVVAANGTLEGHFNKAYSESAVYGAVQKAQGPIDEALAALREAL